MRDGSLSVTARSTAWATPPRLLGRNPTMASPSWRACRSPWCTAPCLVCLQDDAQARYIEIEVQGITLIGIYLPNGNSRGEEGFAYKLAWMDCLADRAQSLAGRRPPAGHHRRLQRLPDG